MLEKNNTYTGDSANIIHPLAHKDEYKTDIPIKNVPYPVKLLFVDQVT